MTLLKRGALRTLLWITDTMLIVVYVLALIAGLVAFVMTSMLVVAAVIQFPLSALVSCTALLALRGVLQYRGAFDVFERERKERMELFDHALRIREDHDDGF